MKTSTEELLAFVTVVDRGSITAAADTLGQTTSGISRALGRLEQKLATTLLNRTTRRLDLTDEGRIFLEHARGVIAALDAAEEAMLVRRERPAGRLRVDAASPFMLHVLVPLLAEFCARYPEIALELTSNDQFIDLLERRTDVAIRIGHLPDSTLHARSLGQTGLRLLAAPAYLLRAAPLTCPQDLLQHSLLGFTQPDSLNLWPLQHAGKLGMAIKPTLSASSGETLRQLALAGHGITCLSDFMTGPDRASGQLVEVLPQFAAPLERPIQAVYYRNTQLAARIVCFLDFLAASLPATL
jgi:DNA-binding transcriptional LysR family regulator